MTLTTLTDKPKTLNLQGYPGNSLTIELTIQGDSPMPVVTSRTYYANTDTLLTNRQATVSPSGRVVTIRYENTTGFADAYHEILFDGRRVLAGSISMVRSPMAGPSLTQASIVIADPASPLQVEIVGYTVSGPGPGSVPTPSDLPASALVPQLLFSESTNDLYLIIGNQKFIVSIFPVS